MLLCSNDIFIQAAVQDLNIFNLLSDMTKPSNPNTFQKLQLYAFCLI